MRNHEIYLTHGEVNVTIETDAKALVSGYGCQYFEQTYFVTMVDSFDDITLEVTAVLSDDLRPEWTFTKANLFEAGVDEADLESSRDMAEELIENHEFLDGLTEAFYR